VVIGGRLGCTAGEHGKKRDGMGFRVGIGIDIVASKKQAMGRNYSQYSTHDDGIGEWPRRLRVYDYNKHWYQISKVV